MLDPDLFWTRLEPAAGVAEWIQASILAEDGPIHNPEHGHLIDADIRYLWASQGFNKQGRGVIGQAEQVMFRTGGWQKARQEQQMREWFGNVPTYIITLDASYCAGCSDADFCALVEHELYHIAQQKDAFGAPAFTSEGLPKLGIRGHDVEEFVGVVRRYGVGAQDGFISRMVAAANNPAEVSTANIAGACGTCLKLVA